MKKVLWMIACLCIGLSAAAQQQGVVRTLERPGKPSVGIEGVSVEVLEYPNVIVSKKGGKFSFAIPGKRQGDSYTVTRVQKKGYTLVDKQLKGRRFAYSATVPIEIVMVADRQLEDDKKRIEDKAYSRAKNDYDRRLALLEKQLQEKTISEREYYESQEKLNANYNNYIKLIDQMAERYATTDYKDLSELNRKILECIENAELERADSLINTKGDFDKREQELSNKHELVMRTEQLSKQLQDNYNAELQDLIQDYYNKYTIHAAAYRNDSAAFYLERIVHLSPNDVSMIEKTGDFIGIYLADYQRALYYYQLGLEKTQEQYGEEIELLGSFYNHVGWAYGRLDSVEKAVENHHKALDLFEQIEYLDSAKIANTYLRLGQVYIDHDYYNKGLENTLKSLEFYERAPGENIDELNSCYNNLGVVFSKMQEYEKSLECHFKALDLCDHYDRGNIEKSASYLNIATVYSIQKDYIKALDYYLKALDVYQQVAGPAHPRTIITQIGIGNIYHNEGNLEKALEHYQEALKGSERYYGEDNDMTINLLVLIAKIHFNLGDKDLALQELQRSTDAVAQRDGTESIELAQNYIGIANDLMINAKGYDEALQYYQKAQHIFQALGLENESTIIAYANPGTIYYWQKQYDKALDCFLKVLDIEKNLNGDQSNTDALIQKQVGDIYKILGKEQLALEYLQLALGTLEQSPDRSSYEGYISEIKATIEELKGTN